MSDDDARRALSGLLEGAPALRFGSADLVAAGRQRHARRRAAAALVAAASATVAVAGAVAVGAARNHHPAPVAATPPPHTADAHPRLRPTGRCTTTQLTTPAIGTAGAVLRAHLAQVTRETPGEDFMVANQGCPPRGAERALTASLSVPPHWDMVSVDIDLYATPHPVPDPACTPAACRLSTLPDGRTVARYEERIPGTSYAQHTDLYDSPYLRISVQQQSTFSGGHYLLDQAQVAALLTDPGLLAAAEQLAAAR